MTFVKPRNADPLVAADEDFDRTSILSRVEVASIRDKAACVEPTPDKPRHDEALLRIYLSAMPLGKYHKLDGTHRTLCCDGKAVAIIDCGNRDHATERAEGLVAALVHLLNTREQTEIPR